MCGGSNLSTGLVLWGSYIKKCISLVRIWLQVRNTRNASTKFRKTLESKKTEKSLEISVFLLFSCLHLNQTLIMAGMAGFEPTNAGVKVPCLTAWRHPNKYPYIVSYNFCFVNREMRFSFLFSGKAPHGLCRGGQPLTQSTVGNY